MAGLFGALARVLAGRMSRTDDTTLDSVNWTDWGWTVPTAAGVAVGQASAMQVTAVYACVSILASDIAKLGMALFAGERKGKRQRVANHPVARLLKRPNGWMTWFEFAGMLQASLCLRGNGYAVILRDPRNGDPTQLVPINPDRVALWEAPDGHLFYMVTRSGLHEMAVLRDMPLLIAADDMFHLKGLTVNGLLGLSPISMAREAIGLSIAQEQLASRWSGNSAQPRGILTTDQTLSPEEADRMKERWQMLNAGLFNAGRTAVLEKGLKWQPLSMTAQDMQFIAARQFQIQEIARTFRVPLHMLGELTRSTNNNITQQSQEYLNYSLSTHIAAWETRLAFTFGIDEDEDRLFFEVDVDQLLRADIGTRYAAHRVSLGGTGWRTMNEVRADEGEEPVEGGDTVYRPVNTAPVTSDVFAANPDPNDPSVPGSPSAPGIGSDQTGEGAEGGGRPKEDMTI
jgi:HK97 family phage portal protein